MHVLCIAFGDTIFSENKISARMSQLFLFFQRWEFIRYNFSRKYLSFFIGSS